MRPCEDPIDPIEVGSTEKAGDGAGPAVDPIPVPRLVRDHALRPQDYQIIMVFQNEAHLASKGELWRVQVGSEVPGLGKILAIEPGKNGGTVRAENATLTGVVQ